MFSRRQLFVGTRLRTAWRYYGGAGKKGFRYYWKWISRRKGGRPVINWELINLIKKLSRGNPGWGNMRIRDELRFLGMEVALNTVKK